MMGTHLVVDWGEGGWSGLQNYHLMDITCAPVLNKALMAKRGGLESPKNLARYPIIHQRNRSEWMSWLTLAGCAGLTLKDEITIMDTNMVMHTALDGQGVSLGIFPFVDQELKAGKLVKTFDIELKPTRSFYLRAKPSSERTPEVASVIRWLLDQAGAS